MRPVLVGMSGAMRRRALEQLEAPRVLAARARHAVEPRHRLGVVVQDVGPRVEHGAQRRFLALEVGNQHLDAAVGHPRLDLADRVGEDRRAAVGQVVAIDRRDDGVAQAHRLHRFGDAHRLVEVERGRPAVLHGAVGAGARAHVAEDHEGGGAVVPALADVRAVRVLADRVELQVAHDALEPEVVLRTRGADLQPVGLRLTRA